MSMSFLEYVLTRATCARLNHISALVSGLVAKYKACLKQGNVKSHWLQCKQHKATLLYSSAQGGQVAINRLLTNYDNQEKREIDIAKILRCDRQRSQQFSGSYR